MENYFRSIYLWILQWIKQQNNVYTWRDTIAPFPVHEKVRDLCLSKDWKNRRKRIIIMHHVCGCLKNTFNILYFYYVSPVCGDKSLQTVITNKPKIAICHIVGRCTVCIYIWVYYTAVNSSLSLHDVFPIVNRRNMCCHRCTVYKNTKQFSKYRIKSNNNNTNNNNKRGYKKNNIITLSKLWIFSRFRWRITSTGPLTLLLFFRRPINLFVFVNININI